MLIVKIEANEGFHSSEFQNGRTKCWLDGYVEVPESLKTAFMASRGFCDLVIEDGILTNIIPNPDYKPDEESSVPAQEEKFGVSYMEQLRADIDFISVMTGVEL